MPPRRGRTLGEVHHGRPHAREGKENDQRTEASGGEQEKTPTPEDLQAPGRPPPKGL